MVYFRNRRKSVFFVCFVLFCFLSQFYFNKGKDILRQKSPFCKAFYIHVSTEYCLTFVTNFLFLKILAFLAKRTHFNLKRQSKVTFLTQLDFIIHISPILHQQNLAGRTFPPTLIIFFFYSLCLFFCFVLFCFSIICFKF